MEVRVGVKPSVLVWGGSSLVVGEPSACLLDQEDPGCVVPHMAAVDEEGIDRSLDELDKRQGSVRLHRVMWRESPKDSARIVSDRRGHVDAGDLDGVARQ